MKACTSWLGLIMAVGLLQPVAAWTQNDPRSGPEADRGREDRMSRMYNPAATETIRGRVAEVERMGPATGPRGGVHLVVKTEDGNVPVMVGPSWYVEDQKVEFHAGDKIEVTGSKMKMDDHSVLLAAEIKKGDQVLRLREKNGMPLWARAGGPGGPGPRAGLGRGMMGEGMMQGGMMRERGPEGKKPEGEMAKPGMMGKKPMRESMMAECQAMMKHHEEMMGKLKEMDARLKRMLGEMNGAYGEQKIDLMAATINELVAQRLAIDRHIAEMSGTMLKHMRAMERGNAGRQTGAGA